MEYFRIEPITDNQPQPTEEQLSPTQVDYQALYAEQKRRVEDLEATIAAGRIQPVAPHPAADIKPKSFEQARAQVGEARWHRMSNAERLVSMGQDPNQDLGFVRQLWGKGADPALSGDLYKSNPLKYRQTREAALALNLFRN